MSEEIVVSSVAGILNDRSCRGVNRLALHTRTGRSESRFLSAMNDIKDPLHLVACFAEDERPRNIRAVALNNTAIIDHCDGVFLNNLGSHGSVRIRAPWPDFDACFSGKADPGIRFRD